MQKSLIQANFGIGGLLSPMVVGALLASKWGWSSSFFIIASLCLSLLLLSYVAEHPSPTSANVWEKTPCKGHIQTCGGQNWLAIFVNLQIWLMGLFIALYAGLQSSLSSWVYSFALLDRHLSPSLASILVSSFWLSLLFARLLLPFIAKWLHRSRGQLIFFCLGGTILGLSLLWLVPGGTGVRFCSFLLGLSLGPLYPTALSLVPSLVSKPSVSRGFSI